MSMIVMNLVIPKAGAKHEILFNELASEADSLNKCSCLSSALSVTNLQI